MGIEIPRARTYYLVTLILYRVPYRVIVSGPGGFRYTSKMNSTLGGKGYVSMKKEEANSAVLNR